MNTYRFSIQTAEGMKPYRFYFPRLMGIKTYSFKVRKCEYFYFFVLSGLFKTGRLLIFSNFPPRTFIQDRTLIVFGQFPPQDSYSRQDVY